MKNFRKERAEARKKAKELVSKMTLMEKAAQLRYDAAPVERLGVPAYNYWNEALHGVARAGTATMFPQAIAMAAAFDEEGMKKGQRVLSDTMRDVRHKGTNRSCVSVLRVTVPAASMWERAQASCRASRRTRGDVTVVPCEVL